MANISDTWDAPFEAQLKAETFISRGDDTIRNVRRALEERFGREHDLDLSDQTNHGRHPQMAARTFLSKPSIRPDGEDLDSNDKGKVAVFEGDFWVWSGSDWVEAKARYLSSSVKEIHVTNGSNDEYMSILADWLDQFSITVGKLIACRFHYDSGGELRVKGGWLKRFSSELYTIHGIRITSDNPGLASVSFNGNTTLKWRESFGRQGSYPAFHLVVQG